jgi:hypothetical protein
VEDCLAKDVSLAAALSVNAVVKHSTPVRDFLRWELLKPSPEVEVIPHLSPKVSVASSSTLVVKEDGVEGAPSLLGGCVIPTAEKG